MTFLKYEDNVSFTPSFNGVKLTTDAKMIYSFFVGLKRNNKKIYPTYAYLAQRFCLSRSTVIRSIEILENAGLVSSTNRFDSSKIYTVLIMPEAWPLAPNWKEEEFEDEDDLYEEQTEDLTSNITDEELENF